MLPSDHKLQNDYSRSYTSEELAESLNNIEQEIGIVNQEMIFGNLVNTSTTKSAPFYSWGRYREGYSGELVNKLMTLAKVEPEKHFVLDPMCGSGSTLIAAAQAGIDSIGIDVLPYAVSLSNVKFIRLNQEQIVGLQNILKTEKCPVQLLDNTFKLRFGGAKKYFNKINFNEVLCIRKWIGEYDDDVVENLTFIAWLAILESCSDRKKDGNGLATRPSKVSDCWNLFCETVQRYLADMDNHQPRLSTFSEALRGEAQNCASILKIQEITKKKSLGAIIFSPPYANSFDYTESYKIELIMGEWYSSESLPDARSGAIRSYRKGYGDGNLESDDPIIDGLCQEIIQRIPAKEEKAGGRRDYRSRLLPNLIVGYFEDMRGVLFQFKEIMPSDSSCFIVVDQSAYLGIIIPTDLILAKIAKEIGFDVHPLIRCRNAKTSPQQQRQYPHLKEMLRESIVHIVQP